MKETVRVLQPAVEPLPLVFDSPHSGSAYPEDFGHAIDRMTLRRSEDAHVEELFARTTRLGATLIHALFPRAYVDPNRNEDDIDIGMFDGTWTRSANPTFKTLERGVGLIWKNMKAFGPIYERKLSVGEVEGRIDDFWRPYHTTLKQTLDGLHSEFGRVFHVNCHSMASHGDRTTEDGPVPRPDFVVSDRDGATCSPDTLDCVVETLRSCGHSVAINDPYKGYELVRRHGRPAENRHSIQVEVNRALYMCEETLSKTPGYLETEDTLMTMAQGLAQLAK